MTNYHILTDKSYTKSVSMCTRELGRCPPPPVTATPNWGEPPTLTLKGRTHSSWAEQKDSVQKIEGSGWAEYPYVPVTPLECVDQVSHFLLWVRVRKRQTRGAPATQKEIARPGEKYFPIRGTSQRNSVQTPGQNVRSGNRDTKDQFESS